MAAHQAPPSLGFSRQEHWSGLPFPSPMHESEKWKVKVKLLSRVRLFVTPWTAAHQAPPSMGFSRQEYWSGVPLPSPDGGLTPSKMFSSSSEGLVNLLCNGTRLDNLICPFRNKTNYLFPWLLVLILSAYYFSLWKGNLFRTGHGTTDWFQIGKGDRQGCILSPCLFNLHAEYIMRNAGLEEAQAGIKISGRNINNLRYAVTPPLWQKVKRNSKASWWKWKWRVKKLA